MNPTPPSDAHVTLVFEKFSAFVEDYASNLSIGGMFLETTDLRPVGSIVDFEVKLTDGFRLVRGLGEVIWLLPGGSAPSGGTARPAAGFAVRFQSLDERGRELILKIMEEQVKRGGELFDLGAVPAGALTSQGSAPVAAAESGDPARLDEADGAPGGEPKILGEDGFTLLDAAGPPSGAETVEPQRVFEELEFDAPWGENLPEIPLEVLEEVLAAEGDVPQPDGVVAAEDVFELDDEVFAAPAPFDDSFLVAEEAVAELDLAALPEADEPDFEDIDFSVPPLREDAAVPPPGPAAAGLGEYEDPTFLTSPPRAATDLGEPPAAAHLDPEHGAPAAARAEAAEVAEPDSFEPVPEASAPAAPPPTAVQKDEDLFADASGAGTRQVLRQALAGSGRLLALAAVVLALVGAVYLYREALDERLGVGGSAAEPPAPAETSVAARPSPAPDAPPPPEPGEAGSEAAAATAAASAPEAEDADSLAPPVIEVLVEEDADVVAESEAAAEEPAEPLASPPPAGQPATRVDRISWRRGEAGTLVTVELDGDLASGRCIHSQLAYAPDREMVEIEGIVEPYASGRIEVGSSEVQQIRIGHQPGGNLLRIVFDFPDAGPRVAEVRSRGDRLDILVRR